MTKSMGMNLDQLRSNISLLPQDQQKKARSLLSKMGIDLTQPNIRLTGTGVAFFSLEDQIIEAESHIDVYLKVCAIILKKYPEFEEEILKIRGTKKKYFSKSVGDFRHGYEQIAGTRIYTDTNENAIQLNRRCQKILQVVGLDPSSLWIMPK